MSVPRAAAPSGPPPGMLGLPAFRAVCGSAAAGAFGRVCTQVALSWIALEVTGSPFMVGLALAARMLPQLVFGIPLGVVVEWFDRRALIVAINVVTGLIGLLLAAGTLAGVMTFPALIGAAVMLGMVEGLRTMATQAYAYDLVRAARATRGIAVMNVGVQLFSAFGGLIGGYALAALGGAAAWGLLALASAVAAVLPARAAPPAGRGEAAVARPKPKVREILTLVTRNRLLLVLVLTVMASEALGFSFGTLMPTFARDVFEVGAGGLGLMLATRSIGGVLGLLVLARYGTGDRSGLYLLVSAAAFGALLVLFASSTVYGLALALLVLIGVVAANVDSLTQTLMQRGAADHERGAAMGIWLFGVGFGPVGHLSLGAVATVIGAPLALTGSGSLLVLAALLLGLNLPLRRMR